jgi:hypothetical protein
MHVLFLLLQTLVSVDVPKVVLKFPLKEVEGSDGVALGVECLPRKCEIRVQTPVPPC